MDNIDKVLKKLNNEQLTAVKDTLNQDALVLAGPGSGKCIKGDSILFTDKGLITIDDIPNHYSVNRDNECSATIKTVDLNGMVYLKKSSHYYDMGVSETIEVTTSKGYVIEGTKEHPIVALNKSGNLEFKKLENITDSDIVAICLNNDMWNKKKPPINKELAYVFGLLCGDGMLSGRGGTIGFSKGNPDIYEKYIEILQTNYPDCKISKTNRKDGSTSCDWYFHNIKIKREFESYGLKMTTAGFKEIPHVIMQGNKGNAIKFLQGLFDTDATVSGDKYVFEYSTKSFKMATQVHMILLNLGIVSRLKPRKVKGYPGKYYYIYISGTMLRKFYKIIGFRYESSKQAILKDICTNTKANDNLYVLHNQSDRLSRIRNRVIGRSYYSGRRWGIRSGNTEISLKSYITGKKNPSCPTIKTLLDIVDFTDSDTAYLRFLVSNFYFDKIKSIKNSKAHVYDFTIPETHSFVANGFVNHNTRVLMSRYLYLLSLGIPANNLMAVTFTNKAAGELKSRITQHAKDEDLSRAFIGTFHSICVKLLKIYGKTQGFDKFTIIDTTDSKNVIKSVLGKRGILVTTKEADGILSKISDLKSSFVTPFDFSNTIKKNEDQIISAAYTDYTLYNKQHNLIDFDDIILNTIKMLEDDAAVKQRINDRFKYIMVDEVQDSALAQHRLTKLLGEGNNIFLVGDIDQSLYGWRQAKPQYLANFDKTYPNGKIIELKQNYRSTGTIIKAAGAVIQNNLMRYAKEMECNRPEGEKIYVCEFSGQHAEASTIVQNIQILKSKRGYEYNDFAILYRTKAQSRIFEDKLIGFNVPYKIVNGVQFYERMEIKDLLSYIRIITNHSDDLAVKRALGNIPKVGKKMIENLTDEAEKTGQTLFDTISNVSGTGQAKDNIREFVQIISEIEADIKTNKIGVSDSIEHIIAKLKYESVIANDKNYDDRVENIEEFIRIGAEFDQEVTADPKTLEAFIEKITLSSDQDGVDEDNTVKLMTCHTAKGLEFKVVFIVNMIEGIMPHQRSQTASELEEERRIFFVAMTRAEDLLFLTYSVIASDMKGLKSLAKPSRYLSELPKECISFKQL